MFFLWFHVLAENGHLYATDYTAYLPPGQEWPGDQTLTNVYKSQDISIEMFPPLPLAEQMWKAMFSTCQPTVLDHYPLYCYTS